MSANESNGDDSTRRRRLILLALVVVVLLCLVGVLAFNLFFRPGGDDIVGGDTPTPTEEGPEVIVTPEEEITPTPTRVVAEEPTEEPTPTPEITTEPSPTPEPAPPTPAPSNGTDFTPTSGVTIYETADLLENGSFEGGFRDTGIPLDWQAFRTDGAVISFSPDTQDPLVHSGSSALRISLQEAHQTDQYAGIHQTLEVVPNKPYTFTIYGQARTFYGDVEKSGYGYRVQYAVDDSQDWQRVPTDAWMELPWGEELYGAPDPEFSMYTTVITPTSKEITLFVRTWGKWADPKLVEYTFDSISFVGSVPGSGILVSGQDDEIMIERPLPVTGAEDFINFMADGRFWGSVLVLLLLGIGAIYRARWSW